MANNSMLSLKYSWLGAGVFALFSCYVALSGVGVSSSSQDVSLAGSVSIHPHTKQALSYSASSTTSKLDSSESANLPSKSKAVVEVPLSAPVANFPETSGVGFDNFSQAKPTLEGSKSIEGNPPTTTTSLPPAITTGKEFNPPKDGQKKGTDHGKSRSKLADNRDRNTSSTNLPMPITSTSTTTLSVGTSSNLDN